MQAEYYLHGIVENLISLLKDACFALLHQCVSFGDSPGNGMQVSDAQLRITAFILAGNAMRKCSAPKMVCIILMVSRRASIRHGCLTPELRTAEGDCTPDPQAPQGLAASVNFDNQRYNGDAW